MSLGSLISKIQHDTTILEVGGLEVNDQLVIDQSGMIAQSQIKDLQANIASIQSAIGNASGTSDINMQGHFIKNVANASDPGDAVNLSMLESATSGIPSNIIQDNNSILIGKSTSSMIYKTGELQLYSTGSSNCPVTLSSYSADTTPCSLVIGKSRGTSVGALNPVLNNDGIGEISFVGVNTTGNFVKGANIAANVVADADSGIISTRMDFSTCQSGAGDQVRMSVSANGIDAKSNKIVNVASPTSGNDAVNKTYCDTSASNCIRRDGTSVIVADIPMSNHKITGLAVPTVSSDAATKSYVDGKAVDLSSCIKVDGTSSVSSDIPMNSHKITGLATCTASNDAANKSYVDSAVSGVSVSGAYMKLDGTSNPTADISLNLHKIINLDFPIDQYDATNKNYVDTAVAPAITRYGSTLVISDIPFNNHKITGLATCTSNTDAANKAYVDNTVTSVVSGVDFTGYIRKDGTSSPSADISLNSHKLINVATCTADTDAANKAYVDAHSASVNLSNYVTKDGSNLSDNCSMGGYRWKNCGDPSDPQDLTTKNYCDTHYISVSSSLTSTYNLNLASTYDRAYYVNISPQFIVSGNVTQANAYGLYINSGTVTLYTNSNITTGYGLYVQTPNYGTYKYAAGFNGDTVTTGIFNVVNSTNTSGYKYVSNISVNNSADGSSYSRMFMGQYSTNVMFIEAANQSNTKGTLFLQPYGGNVKSNAPLDMSSNKISNVADPTSDQDAVTLNYLSQQISFVQQLAWNYTPICIGVYNAGKANNYVTGQNFTCQYPWCASPSFVTGSNRGQGGLYVWDRGAPHFQVTNGTDGVWVGLEIAIPANGLYKINFSLQSAADRGICDCIFQPGSMGNTDTTNVSLKSTICTVDTYTSTSLGATEMYVEGYFSFTRWPTQSLASIQWKANGKNVASSAYYLLLGTTVSVYRLR